MMTLTTHATVYATPRGLLVTTFDAGVVASFDEWSQLLEWLLHQPYHIRKVRVFVGLGQSHR